MLTETDATTDLDTMKTTVPAHIIPAELPHPTTLGTPLARGIRYLHHFEVLLVSDGRRLWAAASAEGQAVLAMIEGEGKAHEDAIQAHKEAAPMKPDTAAAATAADLGVKSVADDGKGTDPANPGNKPANTDPAQVT